MVILHFCLLERCYHASELSKAINDPQEILSDKLILILLCHCKNDLPFVFVPRCCRGFFSAVKMPGMSKSKTGSHDARSEASKRRHRMSAIQNTSNNESRCVVVKSLSEMRISSTREIRIVDATQIHMSTSHEYIKPISGRRCHRQDSRKYHDYINVMIPMGKEMVVEQMKIVVSDLENVLREIHTVVGDLQILVNQIDIVTNKIDGRQKYDGDTSASSSDDSQRSLRAVQGPEEAQPNPPHEIQPLDLTRRQAPDDSMPQYPCNQRRRPKKQSNKIEVSTKKASSAVKAAGILGDVLQCSAVSRNEQHYPVGNQLHNEVCPQSNVRENSLENTVLSNMVSSCTCSTADTALVLSSRDENSNLFEISCVPDTSFTTELLPQHESCPRPSSCAKCNQEHFNQDTSVLGKAATIAGSASGIESDYSGIYELELDRRLELEFDDNLENYTGIDENNTLELKNYRDYRLFQNISKSTG